MEISSANPQIDLASNLRQGEALSNGSATGLGNQIQNQSAVNNGPQLGSTPDAGTLATETDQLSSAAEDAFSSLFFSLLQNILAEAQSNSGG